MDPEKSHRSGEADLETDDLDVLTVVVSFLEIPMTPTNPVEPMIRFPTRTIN